METIRGGSYDIHIGKGSSQGLGNYLRHQGYSRIFVLTDENTAIACWPLLSSQLSGATHFSVKGGERFKSLSTCEAVWQRLSDERADRGAVLVNLGGGLIGDLGGFSAACYKRGISFVQVPTTLLSMVDASVGAKTGVNFAHFKNQVGAFKEPDAVFIDPVFLKTLSEQEVRSGFAEMLKHGLIADQPRWSQLTAQRDWPDDWSTEIAASIQIKIDIVSQDPFEKGPRKALNFGHTIGHALESFFMEQETKLLHGEAVALGMVAEAYISADHNLLSTAERDQVRDAIFARYPRPSISRNDFPALAELCLQDKKNRDARILCTLLKGLGNFLVDQEINRSDIDSALTYTFSA